MSQSQPDFNAVFVAHPDGLILVNDGDQIVAINPAAVRLLAIDYDAWLYQPMTALCDAITLPTISIPGEIHWLQERTGQYVQIRTVATSSETSQASTLYIFTTQTQMIRQIYQNMAVMSHELRMPITMILGHSELLLRDFLGSISHEQCDAIGDRGEPRGPGEGLE